MASVDGLISGLSTTAVIDQLMAAESRTQTGLRNRVSLRNRQIEAFQSVNTKLGALLKATDSLVSGQGLEQVKATSSSSTVVATATPGALTGSMSFVVDRLARAEVHLSSTVASTDAMVTTGDPITVNGQAVTVADGRLSSVVSAINARDDLGVRAAAVKVGEGEYRLQLTATKSGAASDFTTTGLVVTEAVPGQDAQISVAGGAYTVKSSSNTFTDVMPGVTFTVTKAAEEASIDVSTDPGASADVVKGLVDAANAVLDEIDRQTAYNPTSRNGGPLAGESLMRDLEQRVLGAIRYNGGAGSLGEIGVQTTREGRFSFDAEKFTAALEADPAKVKRILDVTAVTSGASLVSVSGTKDTVAGTYDVTVTAAATRATGSLAVGASLVGGERFTVALADGRSVTYDAAAGDTAAEVATGLQARATADGLALTIVQDPADATKVAVSTVAYGSAAKVTLTDPAGTRTSAGTDVAGTIGGATATGRGNVLTVTDTTAAANGVSVTVVAGATGALGSLSITDGFAKAIAAVADRAGDKFDGSVTKAIEGKRSEIKSLDGQIASWDQRLELRRRALERQFSGLEVALSKLRNQSTWLAGQINGLPQWQ